MLGYMGCIGKRRHNLIARELIIFLDSFNGIARGKSTEQRCHIDSCSFDAGLAKSNRRIHCDAGINFHKSLHNVRLDTLRPHFTKSVTVMPLDREESMTSDGSETITLSRAELYDKIWNTATTKLARDFGPSDVALGKICKKHSIPKPPLGYWAKLAHGKAVARPPLPKIDDQRLEIIEIRKRPLFPTGTKPQPPELAKELPIPVPERLTSPHPLVRSTIDALKNSTPDETGILRTRASGCLKCASVGRVLAARCASWTQ